jgi:hypothetical protein
METPHHKQSWLERYWWLLVIAFGIICILCLDFWHPMSGS